MRRLKLTKLTIGLAVLAALFAWNGFYGAQPAMARAADDFLKGKTLEGIVFSSPGGGYDQWARLLGPYLRKYSGASKVIVRNMPGAGGSVAWNYMYSVAKPDGLTIAVGSGMSMVLDELLGDRSVKYQYDKFEWLARIDFDAGTLAVGKNSPYKSIEDIRKATLFKFGTTGRTNMFGVMPVVTGLALGAKNFKVVPGYKGGAEVQLATIREEVNALCSSYPSIKHLIDSGDLVMKAIISHKRLEDLPNTPTIFELVPKMPADAVKWIETLITTNELGRIILTSPGVPKERVQTLTKVIKDALSDAEFAGKAKKMAKYVDYLSPEEQRKQLKVLALTAEEKKYLKYLIFEKY